MPKIWYNMSLNIASKAWLDLTHEPRLQGPAAPSHRRSAHRGQTTFPGLILLSRHVT